MEIIYEQSWYSYEEWAGVRIIEDNLGNFYSSYNGYYVMSSENDEEWSKLQLISEEEVYSIMEEWEANSGFID